MAAMYDEIPRIRAERMMDAAQAAAFPHMEKDARKRWIQSLSKVSRRAATIAAKQQGGLTWNGQAVPSRDAFKQHLALAFGGFGAALRSPTTPRQTFQERRFGAGRGDGAVRPNVTLNGAAGGYAPAASSGNGQAS